MPDWLKKLPKSFRDNKLSKLTDLDGCPFWVRFILEAFYWGINGLFVTQFFRSFFVADQETLKIFCFPHSNEGFKDQFMFYFSGLSAIFGFIVCGGHFLILLGSTCIGDCCKFKAEWIKNCWLFNLSIRTYNAIAMLNVTWFEQISMTCANPDSGVYVLDFEKETFLSVTTLLSLIVAFLNLVLNMTPKSLPCKKCLKGFMRIADFVSQPLNFGVSLYFWFTKFKSDSFIFWVLFVFWVFRIIQSVATEIRKWRKKDKEDQEAKDKSIELKTRKRALLLQG